MAAAVVEKAAAELMQGIAVVAGKWCARTAVADIAAMPLQVAPMPQ
jgi:hypothetical protein